MKTSKSSDSACNSRFEQSRSLANHAFTLVEIMVSMAILLSMMLVITEVISQAQRSWKSASSRLSQFREARQAFDTIIHGLRQAEINAYYGYTYGGSANSRIPATITTQPNPNYQEFAECAFITNKASSLFPNIGNSTDLPGDGVLFQGPFGQVSDNTYRPLYNSLCARGYYVKFGDSRDSMPQGLVDRLQVRYRYRLYELRQSTEYNRIYTGNIATGTPSDWKQIRISNATGGAALAAAGTTAQPIAQNMVGLVFAPLFGDDVVGLTSLEGKLPTGLVSYSYDSDTVGSQHRLPRAVRVIAFAIDEESAVKLAEQSGTSCPNLLSKSGATFTTPSELTKNLETFRESMDRLKINFRIFSATAPVLSGNW